MTHRKVRIRDKNTYLATVKHTEIPFGHKRVKNDNLGASPSGTQSCPGSSLIAARLPSAPSQSVSSRASPAAKSQAPLMGTAAISSHRLLKPLRACGGTRIRRGRLPLPWQPRAASGVRAARQNSTPRWTGFWVQQISATVTFTSESPPHFVWQGYASCP